MNRRKINNSIYKNVNIELKLTLGTCGLNSTARCIASTADISAAVKPRLLATSGENLNKT